MQVRLEILTKNSQFCSFLIASTFETACVAKVLVIFPTFCGKCQMSESPVAVLSV